MLTLSSLFTNLCLDSGNFSPQARLLALAAQDDPELHACLENEDETCRAALTALFARPATPIGRLSLLALAQVRMRHRLDEERPIDGPLLAALAGDPLCLLLLSEALNRDIGFERVCMRLRRACLDQSIHSAVHHLLAALALQAWNNEYVWEETTEETAAVEILATDIDAAIEDKDLASATLPLLRWAMYRPLSNLHVAPVLAAYPLGGVPPVLHPLWQRTLFAPREEAALRSALPTFGEITDGTSRAVRAQYEENPYPRWQRPLGPRKSVLEWNRTYDPAFAWPATFRAPLQILVPGCGTGEHPVNVAAANPEAEVLAVDLSTASLAYAQRMARQMSVGNIRFLHADLLQLPAAGQRFHHIECIGVLHHMDDQQAAWESVASLLHPGGTLIVGVYSKVARLPVTHLRARIVREGVPTTPGAMRAFRAQLLREPKSATLVDRLNLTNGFFTLSMIRDFLFHVHEHPYTLSELEQRVKLCGLRLLGYRLPSQVRRQVALPSGAPTFAQWRSLETAYAGSLEMFLCTLCRPQ